MVLRLQNFGKWYRKIKNYAWVAELVDARDLKSLGDYLCTSSILVPGTIIIIKGFGLLAEALF